MLWPSCYGLKRPNPSPTVGWVISTVARLPLKLLLFFREKLRRRPPGVAVEVKSSPASQIAGATGWRPQKNKPLLWPSNLVWLRARMLHASRWSCILQTTISISEACDSGDKVHAYYSSHGSGLQPRSAINEKFTNTKMLHFNKVTLIPRCIKWVLSL